ncbi:MAG: flagellar filament capping protein FliD [Lachnospiraceae bacterium]|nr:flagellar filament capping protein FliD [Lachnospiraceae bacterium]
MLNVYNYYMQDYVSRTPYYSAHKRRELRDIYKNIVKLSASEPLYKVELSESKQAHALSIKESALLLKDTAYKLQDSPLLHTAGLVSDNTDSVSASLLHRMDLSEFEKDASFEVEVSTLAAGQSNIGLLLPSDEPPLPEGSYSFTVSLGHDHYAFHFNVTGEASAFDLQTKLSDFINKTGIGLEAQVSFNRELGLSRMDLSAKRIGIFGKSSFSLEDTEMPDIAEKGLVEVFGLNQMASPATNAHYTVNGVSYESSENTAVFSDTMLLTFRSATKEPVTIRPVADHTSVYEALAEFTNSYNYLVQAGKNAAQENKSSAFLLNGLTHLIASHYSALNSVGIASNEDGYLTLDSEKAKNAALFGDAEVVFRQDASFIKALNARLETIALNPMKYVDKKLVTYPDPTAPIMQKTSPYTTSIYSGMLFNNYC